MKLLFTGVAELFIIACSICTPLKGRICFIFMVDYFLLHAVFNLHWTFSYSKHFYKNNVWFWCRPISGEWLMHSHTLNVYLFWLLKILIDYFHKQRLCFYINNTWNLQIFFILIIFQNIFIFLLHERVAIITILTYIFMWVKFTFCLLAEWIKTIHTVTVTMTI